MATATDIANRALQVLGTRSSVTDAELAANSTNEALQINQSIDSVRRRLLRMAPWNFAMKTVNLIYITSAPGTPENTIASTTLWQPGQPAPPWTYEYQYPNDCQRMCYVIPSTQTGFAGGVPITTAVTGGAVSFWNGPPVKYKVQNDQFTAILTASLASAGTGYAIGDTVFGPGALNPVTGVDPNQGSAPIGGPVQFMVTGVDGSGGITAFTLVSQVLNTQLAPLQAGVAMAPTIGGSYFKPIAGPLAQSFTTGIGTGATFNVTWNYAQSPQRVILCNQEFASATYVQDVFSPDIMDEQFVDAWCKALGAEVVMALTGNLRQANAAVQEVNRSIEWARTGDGNEGFTVNDVDPDWIRGRGFASPSPYSGPLSNMDWGGLWASYG